MSIPFTAQLTAVSSPAATASTVIRRRQYVACETLAGRLWGERFLMTLPGSARAAKHMPRVRRAGRKLTWPAVVASSFLPIPRAFIFVMAGWAGMRLVTFLVLDLIGVLLWAGLLAGLGYALGHQAVLAARAISHYSWWVTIGIVALTVLAALRSQRRPRTAPADNAP